MSTPAANSAPDEHPTPDNGRLPAAIAAASNPWIVPALATDADANASDEQLVALWLHGRPPLTARAYRRDAGRFRAFVAKPLRVVTLGDLQAFADSLDGQPGTRARILSAVKSLLSFAAKIGALRFNVGAALRSPICHLQNYLIAFFENYLIGLVMLDYCYRCDQASNDYDAAPRVLALD